MRGYCVRFHARVGATDAGRESGAANSIGSAKPRWSMHQYWFDEALGVLRAGLGLQVAITASRFEFDVDDVLASTLPGP